VRCDARETDASRRLPSDFGALVRTHWLRWMARVVRRMTGVGRFAAIPGLPPNRNARGRFYIKLER
jgi:hypothetical protein